MSKGSSECRIKYNANLLASWEEQPPGDELRELGRTQPCHRVPTCFCGETWGPASTVPARGYVVECAVKQVRVDLSPHQTTNYEVVFKE